MWLEEKCCKTYISTKLYNSSRNCCGLMLGKKMNTICLTDLFSVCPPVLLKHEDISFKDDSSSLNVVSYFFYLLFSVCKNRICELKNNNIPFVCRTFCGIQRQIIQ